MKEQIQLMMEAAKEAAAHRTAREEKLDAQLSELIRLQAETNALLRSLLTASEERGL